MLKQDSTEQRQEWIEMLRDAQEKMREAHTLIATYCRESGDGHTEAYIADHLEIMTSGEHGFASRDANLDDVLQELQAQDLHPDDFEDWG